MSCVVFEPAPGVARALRFVRWVSQSPHPPSSGRARAQPVAKGEEEDDFNRPIQFSSSKANPPRWTVEHSLGRVQQRAWWKVLPLSISFLALFVWCFLRQESSSDECSTGVLGKETEPSDRS
uniref:Ubiquinol-cytochrome c reductase complex assembly factor 4 n=1 Tax=Loxodonta africana TaxID=9785 RepID=G3UGG5_LOXAF